MIFMDMLESLIHYLDGNAAVMFVGKVALMLLTTFVISYLSSFILERIHLRLQRTKTIWDDAVIGSLRRPLQLIIWTTGVVACIEYADIAFALVPLNFIVHLKTLIIIFSIIWFIFGIIEELEKYWYKTANDLDAKLDKTTAGAVAKVLRILAVIIAGLMSLESMGFSISSILAFAGGGGVAVGFASKDLLANFFGALMVYLDKPFKVGDWIRIPENDIEGTVEKIGLRCTVIKTLEKRPLYVPNAVFSKASIENPSRMSHRKIYETIGLRYEDMNVISDITSDIVQSLKENKEIDGKLPLFVNINTFTPSAVNLLLCAYTRTIEQEAFHQLKHQVMLNVASIVEKYEAKLSQLGNSIQLPEGVMVGELTIKQTQKEK